MYIYGIHMYIYTLEFALNSFLYTPICTHIYTLKFPLHSFLYTYICVYIYTYIYVYICIYIYTSMCIGLYMYICVFVYIYQRWSSLWSVISTSHARASTWRVPALPALTLLLDSNTLLLDISSSCKPVCVLRWWQACQKRPNIQQKRPICRQKRPTITDIPAAAEGSPVFAPLSPSLSAPHSLSLCQVVFLGACESGRNSEKSVP
jgi:hypothetical protein